MAYIVRSSLFALLSLVSASAAAAERDYQVPWCQARGGQLEVVLPDKTRIDCLTSEYAVEVDFGHKWAEAIGQALHYAMWTGRRGGIVLILSPGDERFLTRALHVVNHYNLPISVWSVRQ